MQFFVFDVDGVTLDYQAGYRRFLKKHYQKFLEGQKVNLGLSLPKDAEWQFLQSEEFSQLTPLIDPKVFNAITKDSRVIFVTNLPSFVYEKRKQNLTDLGFWFENIYLGGFVTYGEPNYPTKSEVLLRWVGRWASFCFVDDHPDNCKEVSMEFPNSQVIMLQGYYDFEPSHNRFKTVTNWADLKNMILASRRPSSDLKSQSAL